MNSTQQRGKLRAILAGSECLSPASVFDPLSARVAESVGYELGLLAGSGVAATTLAAIDTIVYTLTEYADQVRRIMRVSNLSLFVDADHGYGNALNVMRAVRELEHAGLAGIGIEDTAGPLAFGQNVGTQKLVSVPEAVGKMRAALAAREDPSLVIIGRTPALRIEGIESALVRAQAYAAAGVDMIYLVGHEKLEHIQAVHSATRLPILCTEKVSAVDRIDYAACGARILIQGHQVIPAAVKALRDTYTHLFEGGAPADLNSKIASTQEMEQLVNHEGYKQWVREYMR